MIKEIEKIIEETGGIKYGYFKSKSPFCGIDCGISLVVPLSFPVISAITDAPTKTYFHHYRTTNSFIDSLCEKIVIKIMGMGYNAAAIPASQSVDEYSGLFPHKTAAVRAGLGYIGKSALFISNEYGARVRLGTVFTDMPVPFREEKQKDECGDCDICMKKCPAMAISGKPYAEGMRREDIFDARACSEYMKKEFQNIGRGAVCGICMRFCPKNKGGRI